MRHNRETRIPDLLGGGLLVAAVGSIALALVQGPDWGWGSASTIIAIAVTVVSTGLFLVRSARRRAADGTLDRFDDRRLAAGRRARDLHRRRRAGPQLRRGVVVGRGARGYRSVLGLGITRQARAGLAATAPATQ